jgi:hypothetical protein
MKARWIWSICAAALITFGYLGYTPAYAQDPAAKGKGGGKGKGPQAPTGPTPKAADGKPDLSGLWFRPYVPDMTRSNAQQQGPKELPFTDWGKRQWEGYSAEEGDYTGACLPFGLVRSMNSPDPIFFLQNGPWLGLLYEQNTWFKLIPIDGRAHTKGEPTWFGDSVGHWEGDTLVVHTNNFNGKTRLDTIGHPHSDQMETTEKFTRTDLGHMNYEITIHDPKTFTADWTNTRQFTLRTDTQIMEYSCEENNKSLWEGRIKVPDYEKLLK